jgi:hypothetical protein
MTDLNLMFGKANEGIEFSAQRGQRASIALQDHTGIDAAKYQRFILSLYLKY